MNKLTYSPKEHIPLFKLGCTEAGVRYVEYLNRRTGCTERIQVEMLMMYLMQMEEELMHPGDDDGPTMVYSPSKKIPMGIMVYEPSTGCFMFEIKFKHRWERMKVMDYIALMVDPDPRMAS